MIIFKYLQTQSSEGGFGRFYLPLPDAKQKDNWKVNPYGFSVLDRAAENDTGNERTSGILNADASKALPNATNMYGMKEVDFRYVKYSEHKTNDKKMKKSITKLLQKEKLLST